MTYKNIKLGNRGGLWLLAPLCGSHLVYGDYKLHIENHKSNYLFSTIFFHYRYKNDDNKNLHPIGWLLVHLNLSFLD